MFPPREQTGPLMFCRQERWVVFFAFRRAGKLGNPFRLSPWTRTKYTGPAARRFQAVAAVGPAIEPKTLQLRRSESASVSAHIGALIHGRLARSLRVGVGGDTGGRGALYRGFSGRGRRAGSLCSEIVTSVAVENCLTVTDFGGSSPSDPRKAALSTGSRSCATLCLPLL
jgi:hypothetical protein